MSKLRVSHKVRRKIRDKRKECSRCEWKMPKRFFNKESRHVDGLRSECKHCQYTTMLKSITKKVKEISDERNSLCD